MKIASYRCLFFQVLLTLGAWVVSLHSTGITTTKNPNGVQEVLLCAWVWQKGEKWNGKAWLIWNLCICGHDILSESDLHWGMKLGLVRYNNHMVGCNNFDTERTIKYCHGAVRTRWNYSLSFVDRWQKSIVKETRQAQKAHFWVTEEILSFFTPYLRIPRVSLISQQSARLWDQFFVHQVDVSCPLTFWESETVLDVSFGQRLFGLSLFVCNELFDRTTTS